MASQVRERGSPDQNMVRLRPKKEDIQPLANDPIMLPMRKSIAKLNYNPGK